MRVSARRDAAATDLVGTLLLVVVVVALGSVLAVVVAATLDTPDATPSDLALVSVRPGADTLTLRHLNGAPLALADLDLRLARGDGPPSALARSTWTTTDPTTLRPGDSLALPLDPAAAEGERLALDVYRRDANARVASLAIRASAGESALDDVTLTGALTPPTLAPPSRSLLEVRASHPLGALAVSQVRANLTLLQAGAGAAPLTVTLNDLGRDGDQLGGDGVWSVWVDVPTGTTAGAYALVVEAWDGRGARAGNTTLEVQVQPGVRATHGTRIAAPASQAITTMRLQSWAWDARYPDRVDNDVLALRIVDGQARTWSAAVTLSRCGGSPCATQLRIWGPDGDTTYTPTSTQLLSTLQLNLLDPTTGNQWSRSAGSAHPTALYVPSALNDRPVASVTIADNANNARGDPFAQGLLAVDVIFS